MLPLKEKDKTPSRPKPSSIQPSDFCILISDFRLLPAVFCLEYNLLALRNRLTSFPFFAWARVAELVDAVDLKSIACEGVRVQVPPRVPST